MKTARPQSPSGILSNRWLPLPLPVRLLLLPPLLQLPLPVLWVRCDSSAPVPVRPLVRWAWPFPSSYAPPG